MCGLVGIASTLALTQIQKNIMKQLLYVDALRGAHSTGVYSVNSDTLDAVLVKRDVDGPMFVTSKLWDKATSLTTANVMIGHNRFATKGKINSDNAHPFQCGDVTMVHNGTLRTFNGLKDSAQFDTDSETIAHNLASVGVDEAGTVISQLNGAFALVWFDDRDKSLNFIRNDERELYIGHDEKKLSQSQTMYWASEKEILHLCVNRNLLTGTVKGVRLLPAMTHYKMSLAGVKVAITSTKKYEEYKPPVVISNNFNSYYGNRTGDYSTNIYNLPSSINGLTGYKTDDKTLFILSSQFKQTPHYIEGHVPHRDPKKSEMFCTNLYLKNRTIEQVVKELELVNYLVKIRSQYTIDNKTVVVVDVVNKIEYDAWMSLNSYDEEDSDIPDDAEWEDILEEGEEVLYEGDGGKLLNKQEMTQAVSTGCAWCADCIQEKDFDEITWYMGSPVCPSCFDWSHKEGSKTF